MQRVEHRDRRGVVVAARAADVVGDEAEVEVPRLRRVRAAASRARPRASEKLTGDEAGRHAEALLRAGVDGVDPPPVDLDRDAAERRDGVDEQQRVGLAAARRAARSRSRRRSTSPRARPRAGARRDARAARRAAAADRSRGPTAASTRTTSAPQRRATSHMRSPNTPLTPMITVSPGSTRLTKHVSMPADPVPLIGSVSVFVGAEHGAQPVADLVEHDEEVGIEVPEHRALERLHHLGIRIRRPGPEQQSFGVGHGDGRYDRLRRSSGRGRRGCRPPRRASRRSPSAASPTTTTITPPTITSTRPGSRPGLCRRCAIGSVASVRKISSAAARDRRKWWMRSLSRRVDAELDRAHRPHRARRADERLRVRGAGNRAVDVGEVVAHDRHRRRSAPRASADRSAGTAR